MVKILNHARVLTSKIAIRYQPALLATWRTYFNASEGEVSTGSVAPNRFAPASCRLRSPVAPSSMAA